MTSFALSLRPTRRAVQSTAVAVLAVLLAAIFGLAGALLPWFFVIVLVLLPVVVGLSLVYPLLGLVFTLMVIFGVIPEQFHPRVPFGGGKLRVYDLMIVYLTAVMALRQLALQRPILTPLRQFLLPLIYVFACIGVSILHVKLLAPNDRLLSEGRAFIAWMVLPLIVLAVDDQRKFRWFWRAVLGIAGVLAVYVCVQTFGGIRILSSAQDLSTSTTSSEDAQGVIRSAVGGVTYLMVLALFLAINRVIGRRWWLVAALPFALLMLAGLGASFGRAVYLSTLVGIFVSSFVFRGFRAAVLALLVMALLVGSMVGVVLVAVPRAGEAMIDRVNRLGDEVRGGGSFNWRMKENRAAGDSITRHPVFGVGIGADYKDVNQSHGVFAVETVYIHNAYLYFPVKMGLHAALIPFFFIVAAAVAVKRALRARPELDRGRIAALAGTFAVQCVVSLNQPEFVSVGGIASICVVLGLLALEQTFGTMTAEAKSS